MSDWKESSLKRRDFRSAKEDPEIPRHKKKARGKNTYKITCNWTFGLKTERFTLGKYKNLEGAQQALKQYESSMWAKYNPKIEEL